MSLPRFLSLRPVFSQGCVLHLMAIFAGVSTAKAQLAPGGTINAPITTAQTLAGGTGTVDAAGSIMVSGSANAVTGTSALVNSGTIKQIGTGRAIRDNTGGLTLTVTNNVGALIQATAADAIRPGVNGVVVNEGVISAIPVVEVTGGLRDASLRCRDSQYESPGSAARLKARPSFIDGQTQKSQETRRSARTAFERQR